MSGVVHDLVQLATQAATIKHHHPAPTFTYSEGHDRMAWTKKPGHLPTTCDCSSFITLLAYMAGTFDPNGLNFNGTGYTGTILSNPANKLVHAADVLPGDLVVYGAGTGDHVAIITEVKTGGDLVTVSMGCNEDPSYVWVNKPKANPVQGMAVDGRTPQRFVRIRTERVRPALTWVLP